MTLSAMANNFGQALALLTMTTENIPFNFLISGMSKFNKK